MGNIKSKPFVEHWCMQYMKPLNCNKRISHAEHACNDCNTMIAQPELHQPCHLTINDFYTLLDEQEVLVVDIRNYDEQPVIDGFADRRVPLYQLEAYLDELDADAIVFVCQDGTRSATAIQLAKDYGINKPVYSLDGGIDAWLRSKE